MAAPKYGDSVTHRGNLLAIKIEEIIESQTTY
jgi:hypothetical protein